MKVVAKTEDASTSALMSLCRVYRVLEACATSGAWELRASRFICAGSGVEAAWVPRDTHHCGRLRRKAISI